MFYILGSGIFELRILLGPLPDFLCKISGFSMIFLTNNMSLLLFVTSLTKFSLLKIYKSMPVMNDDLIAFIIYSNILFISFLFTLSKFYYEDHPDLAEVIFLIVAFCAHKKS